MKNAGISTSYNNSKSQSPLKLKQKENCHGQVYTAVMKWKFLVYKLNHNDNFYSNRTKARRADMFNTNKGQKQVILCATVTM